MVSIGNDFHKTAVPSRFRQCQLCVVRRSPLRDAFDREINSLLLSFTLRVMIGSFRCCGRTNSAFRSRYARRYVKVCELSRVTFVTLLQLRFEISPLYGKRDTRWGFSNCEINRTIASGRGGVIILSFYYWNDRVPV